MNYHGHYSIRFTLSLFLLSLLSTAPISLGASGNPPETRTLEQIARDSLDANIYNLACPGTILPVREQSDIYLAAGAHQFKSLWTRDFCFSSRGLFHLHQSSIVRDQLELILANTRACDGLVPKVLDSTSPTLKGLGVSVKKLFCNSPPHVSLNDHLKPYYTDDTGGEAIDSNVLVLLTAYDYADRTPDWPWWNRQLPTLVHIYRYYDSKQDASDGLIVQPSFSDWQDSVKRNGKTFYTNLIYYLVSKRLAIFPEFQITPSKLQLLRNGIESRFFAKDWGIYRSIVGSGSTGDPTYPQFSLDANLLAIDLGYFDNDPDRDRAKKVYASLKETPLWRGGGADMPGYVTWPDYPRDWIGWKNKVSGLCHYHDEMYWSWLIALSAKIAWTMGDTDESLAIMDRLTCLAQRDRYIVEIYSPTQDLPAFNSRLYAAESPFSWGAAFVVDAAKEIQGWYGCGQQPVSKALRSSP